MTNKAKQYVKFNRRNVERCARYLGEAVLTGYTTYGQSFTQGLLAKVSQRFLAEATFQFSLPQVYLASLTVLYAGDMLAYSAWYSKLYNRSRQYGMSRAADHFCRAMRDLSMLLVNAGGMALLYYGLLSGPSLPLQITTVVGMTVLKGIMDFCYDFFDNRQHQHSQLDFPSFYDKSSKLSDNSIVMQEYDGDELDAPRENGAYTHANPV